MSKKVFLLAAMMALASCSTGDEAFVRYCPNVQIVPEFSRLTLMAGKEPEARVELVGYEGYCRTDPRGETQAVVAPIFEVSRLTKKSDKAVRFRYYTDNGGLKEKNMIGKEAHSASVEIADADTGKKIMHQGDYVEVRIPAGRPGYPIKMGLVLSNAEYRYNRLHGLNWEK